MGHAYPLIGVSSSASHSVAQLSKLLALVAIAAAAVASREFAVVRFESIIHEFDPWFNYRATRILTKEGFYEFWNWYDATAWYPLGRAAGGTLYPGLMVTSALIWHGLHALHVPVDIRDVCVQLAPAFSGLTAVATYLFTKEVGPRGGLRESAGLWAALFIAITPGYISRSVAGSYDNEAVAIFILMSTFYLWLRALREGSALWGTVTALFYFYMVAAWGGYAFITNMLPLHVLALLLMGRYNARLYVAYSTFYAIGTLASMCVPFVGARYLPIQTSEHMGALGVFGLLQLVAFFDVVRSHVSKRQFNTILGLSASILGLGVGGAFVVLVQNGKIAPWAGRFYSLWDTGYARVHLPLIASVSEHQPTAWPSFFFDLQSLVYLFPAGVYMCFRELRDEHVFVIIYAILGSYFASVMVRLMLTLTPIVCVTAAIVVAKVYDVYLDPAQPDDHEQEVEGKIAAPSSSSAPAKKDKSKGKTSGIRGGDTRLAVLLGFTMVMATFVFHCTWVTSNAYSSPSVVLASRGPDGSQNIIDDFREAYYWLRQNTDKDARVMSWWDYGYQIAGFSERTTLVDNNTWNNTHIATVGKMMSVDEARAYPLLRKHDVDYVLVIFGGLLGYSGDDINKFLWMVRISEGIWPDEVHEPDYFTRRGEYKVDAEASPAMRNSLMYKMCYHRFPELYGGGRAMDRVRQQVIPPNTPALESIEEAFTSENWIVRIYAVKQPDVLDRDHRDAIAYSTGANTRIGGAPSSKRSKKSISRLSPSASSSRGKASPRASAKT